MPEAGVQVHRSVLGAFLQAVVTLDVVEVVSVDDSGSVYLHLGHYTRQNPPLDGDLTSKEAFLVKIGALCSLLRHHEA